MYAKGRTQHRVPKARQSCELLTKREVAIAIDSSDCKSRDRSQALNDDRKQDT